MEAFSLLKYWRGSGGGGGGGDVRSATGTTSLVTAATHNTVETDDDDDGPFFDLEFSVPDEEDGDEQNKENGDNASDCGEDGEGEVDENDDVESDGTDGEGEFKFTLSSGSSNDRTDHTLSLSPSDDLFFKGRLVPIEPSSLVYSGSEQNPKSQFPVSLLKSATKFRVFMLGFKKSRGNGGEKTEQNGSAAANGTPPKQQQKQEAQQDEIKQSKLFTVKFKVEEVPIMSLFTRDNSSRSSSGNRAQKQNEESASSDEKRFSKDVMQKYLKKVKPLYVRVSRRYGEKLKFSGQLSLGSAAKTAPPPPPPPSVAQKLPPSKSTPEKSPTDATEVVSEAPASNVKGPKQGNFPAGLRVVCKHLGKSKSASSAVAAAPPVPVASKRRDDSLLQQQDGIQSAILHCKRSFNAQRDAESTLLARSASDS